MLIYLVIRLILIGLLLWVVDQIPIDATIKRVIHVVIIVCVVIWLIGLLAGGLHVL